VRASEDDCRALHARFLRGRAKLMAIADRFGDTKLPAFSDRQRAAG
jgi:hypothetical protein